MPVEHDSVLEGIGKLSGGGSWVVLAAERLRCHPSVLLTLYITSIDQASEGDSEFEAGCPSHSDHPSIAANGRRRTDFDGGIEKALKR